MHSLKSARPNSKKNSSYYKRLRALVYDYLDGFDLDEAPSDADVNRAADFFAPEWERRDGKFLGKLDRIIGSGVDEFIVNKHTKSFMTSLTGLCFEDATTQGHPLSDVVNGINDAGGAKPMSFEDGLRAAVVLAARNRIVRDTSRTRLPNGMPIFVVKLVEVEKVATLDYESTTTKLPSPMSTKEAKEFFRSVAVPSDHATDGTDDTGEDLAYEVTNAVSDKIKELVQAAIAEHIVSYRNTPEAEKALKEIAEVRAVLKAKGLPTANPAATVLAKLNKKKIPR